MGKNLCRCPITESLMRSLSVVEPEVIAETDPRLSSIPVSLKIHFFVPYRPPQPLDEQVVIVASFPIHADSGTMLFQESGKGLTGELSTLVGVEYIGSALLESFFQSLVVATL